MTAAGKPAPHRDPSRARVWRRGDGMWAYTVPLPWGGADGSKPTWREAVDAVLRHRRETP